MPRIELLIALDDTGQVQVTGPIDQTLLCYGLLEIARDVIAEHKAKAQRLVQPAIGTLPAPPFPQRS